MTVSTQLTVLTRMFVSSLPLFVFVCPFLSFPAVVVGVLGLGWVGAAADSWQSTVHCTVASGEFTVVRSANDWPLARTDTHTH